MEARLILVLLCCMVVGANAPAEERKVEAIPFLVERLSKFNWTDGFITSLALKPSASLDELVANYVKTQSFKDGPIHDYAIEERKTCIIPEGPKKFLCKIARISSEQGGKFLVFRYDSEGWWSRSYDAKVEVAKAMERTKSPGQGGKPST